MTESDQDSGVARRAQLTKEELRTRLDPVKELVSKAVPDWKRRLDREKEPYIDGAEQIAESETTERIGRVDYTTRISCPFGKKDAFDGFSIEVKTPNGKTRIANIYFGEDCSVTTYEAGPNASLAPDWNSQASIDTSSELINEYISANTPLD